VADQYAHQIRKITSGGVVGVVAGSGSVGNLNATGTSASFRYPAGVAVDASGNVYVADQTNHMIRKIASDGTVTTLAGTGSVGNINATGTSASFRYPFGVAVDASGNVYVADRDNHLIRKITSAGVVTTLAGSGTAGSTNATGTAASFNLPTGVAVDVSGNVYVADKGNNLIRKISATGVVTTLAGTTTSGFSNGNSSSASFNAPTGIAVDASGYVYVADQSNNAIRKISPSGVVTTLAGNGGASSMNGAGSNAGFNGPSSVSVDGYGNVYVADQINYLIRKITQTGYTISPALPAGLIFDATTGSISGTPLVPSGLTTYTIQAVNAGGSASTTVKLAVSPMSLPVISYASPQTYALETAISALNPSNTGGAVPAIAPGTVTTLSGISGSAGTLNGQVANATFNLPHGIAVDNNRNLYVADRNNNRIRKISNDGVVTTLAGNGSSGSINGSGNMSTFYWPSALTVDASGTVYIADTYNHLIRKISIDGVVSTFAGSGSMGNLNGTGTQASFKYPTGIAVDASGNLYVADQSNHLIRKITSAGVVSTFAGSGVAGNTNSTGLLASFNNPTGIAVDAQGNVYVADMSNHLIRKITSAGVVSTLAGNGVSSNLNGTGTAAGFSSPYGIAVDSLGNVYVSETGNQSIRKITSAGVVTTLAGSGSSGSTNGVGSAASFYNPAGLAVDGSGNVYVADSYWHLIRKITQTGYSINPELPSGLSFDPTTGSITGMPVAPSNLTTYTVTACNLGGVGSTTLKLAINLGSKPSISYTTPQSCMVGTVASINPANSGGTVPARYPGTVTTVAGYSGLSGSTNGTGTSARFYSPIGLSVDGYFNVYVADMNNNLIRKISAAGIVTTLAGSGSLGSVNSTGTAASFRYPTGTAVDSLGNVYVADQNNHLIRKITATGVVSTFVGSGVAGSANGTGTLASFNYPRGIAIDPNGNLFVADQSNHLIRKITAAGVVSTFAGSGVSGSLNSTGTLASFNTPYGVAVDASGNVYVADQGNHLIRKITSAGVVSTLAGTGSAGSLNGTGTSASFNTPTMVAVDAGGNVYVADQGNHLIRKITSAGVVTTLAGSGSAGSVNDIGTTASFYSPSGLAVDAAGNVYVAESANHTIRKIAQTGYSVSPTLPAGLELNASTGVISGTPIAAATATNYTVKAVNAAGSQSTTLSIAVTAMTPPSISYATPLSFTVNKTIIDVEPTNSGGGISGSSSGLVSTLAGTGCSGYVNGSSTSATFTYPNAVTVDASGNIYVADRSNHMIRKITPSGVVSTFAGNPTYGSTNGTGTGASFYYPYGVAADASGNVYVADRSNHLIRKITAAGVVSTLAGSGTYGSVNGTGTGASFYSPTGVAVDASGNVYVADRTNHLIRKITSAGVVSTFAGSGSIGSVNATGTAASFYYPNALAVDASGNVYVADYGNHLIRKITSAGVVSTLAGSSTLGNANGTGTSASFYYPTGVAVDAAGNVYVADYGNNLIRKVTSAGVVTTLAGSGATGSTNDVGTAASFYNPSGVCLDASGNLIVADTYNQLIRKISLSGFAINPALPAGLSFNTSTGVISGTPTVTSSATTYTITATNGSGTSTTTINLAVNAAPVAPSISYNTPQVFSTGTTISGILPTNTGGSVPATIPATVSTLAGTGAIGNANATGTAASFNYPNGIAVDVAGVVYVADRANNLIRKITPAGLTTTLAGSGASGSANGTGTAASFNTPYDVAVDATGNIYVADRGNNLIRKITSGGVVTTLAGSGSAGSTNGTGTAASFNLPTGIAVDASGNVYVADRGNHLIRKITPAGVVSTLAGIGVAGSANGTGTSASFNYPYSLTVDATGVVYVADQSNNLIRKITAAGVVTTLAGSGLSGNANGTGTSASFNSPSGVTVDALGNVYVADYSNQLIRQISTSGVVRTLAGSGSTGSTNGVGVAAAFSNPVSLETDNSGNLYVADCNNHLIRKIVLTGYSISPALPAGLTFNETTGLISGTPTTGSTSTNYTVTAVNEAGTSTTTLNITINAVLPAPSISYTTPSAYAVGSAVTPLTPTNTGGAVPASTPATVTTLAGSGSSGFLNATGTGASFNYPNGVAVDGSGNVYVADYSNHVIRKITSSGVVTTLAGSGSNGSTNATGSSASFNGPTGVVVDGSGNVYVADRNNHLIRKITSAGVVTTFAGTGLSGSTNGSGSIASFSYPSGLAIDVSGTIYVADRSNHLIRKITASGVVSTLAGNGIAGSTNGTGTAASFNYPNSVAVDASGNVYVADQFNNQIRKVTAAGVVTTFAGTGASGSANGSGASASFNSPYGIASDNAGNLYVAEYSSHLIRKITSAGVVSTYAGSGVVGNSNGVGTNAKFNAPSGMAVDGSGMIYVGDCNNHLIRKISPYGYSINPALPAGLSMNATTGVISGTPTAASAPAIYTVSAFNSTGSASATVILSVAVPVPTIAFSSSLTLTVGTSVGTMAPTNSGGSVPTTNPGATTTYAGTGSRGSSNGIGVLAKFDFPSGMVFDGYGAIYMADQANCLIRKIAPDGEVSTFAGSGAKGSTNGTGTAASFNLPADLVVDASGTVFVTDQNNHCIRKITSSGVVTTLAGSTTAGNTDATGTSARFNYPEGIAIDGAGNLYVADNSNHKIRKVTPAGVVTTIAGTGTPGLTNGSSTTAQFNHPTDLAVDLSGNIFVADAHNQTIRKISTAGFVSTLSGNATTGSTNGLGNLATFHQPYGLTLDASGNLFVAEQENQLVRKIVLTGYSIYPNLPAGLSFDATTGTISGTPTAAASSLNYYITGTNMTGSHTVSVAITVRASAPDLEDDFETPYSTDGHIVVTTLSDQPESGEAVLYNAQGVKMAHHVLSGQTTIVGEQLTPGLYLLYLKTSGKETLKKVLVKP
jgi:sugar lactone lactonase YvrE